MSRLNSFFLALFIYTLLFVALFFSLRSLEFENFGNSSIELLMLSDEGGLDNAINTSGTAKEDDFSKEPNKELEENISLESQQIEHQAKVESQSQVQEQTHEKIDNLQDDFDLDDLFSDIKTKQPAKKKPIQVTKTSTQTSNLQKTASRKATSNSQGDGASAQVSGIFDKYFGRINAYLKNIWSLILANYAQISEQDQQMVDFKISADGVLEIEKFIRNNLEINKAAWEFLERVNQAHKNFGPPPQNKEFHGKARLGVRFSVNIK